jgi:hypothetical protein
VEVGKKAGKQNISGAGARTGVTNRILHSIPFSRHLSFLPNGVFARTSITEKRLPMNAASHRPVKIRGGMKPIDPGQPRGRSVESVHTPLVNTMKRTPCYTAS